VNIGVTGLDMAKLFAWFFFFSGVQDMRRSSLGWFETMLV